MAVARHWGDELSEGGPPALVRHAGCGGEVSGRARCERCGTEVEASDVEWLWGSGSGRPPRRFAPRDAAPSETG